MDDNEDLNHNTERQNVISLMDSFFEQLVQTRKTLVLVLSLSISSIVLAPLAIGLSIFLFLHPSFFAILEKEEEFGLFLIILLSGIIIVSLIWLVTGFKQYRSIRYWNKKYDVFLKKKKDIDRDIATEYDLDKD
jgi:uncharacterized membrane protein